MKFIKYFFLLLSVYTVNVYALMPNIPCNTICQNSHYHKRLTMPGTCVKVDKYHFYYRTLGHGSPTMIFSSGTGFPADGWFDAEIATKIADKIRVFTYDRIFTFNSCPNPNDYMPVTAQDVVNHLRELLTHKNIKPPYILVGQSMGGLYMLLYAREFPKEVAGIVLMDATSDAGPTPLPKDAIPVLKRLGNPQNPTPDNPLYYEITGQLPSYLQIKNAPPLSKNIPLIIMYATEHCLPLTWTKKPICMTPQQENEHRKQQIEMYNMSVVHKLIEVEGDHMSFFTKGKNSIVVDALNSILIMGNDRIKELSKS